MSFSLIDAAINKSTATRRVAWRLGRRVYASARGEPHFNDIAENGEAYVQACVARAVDLDTDLVVFDIGANQGEWTLSLVHALPESRRRRGNVSVELFEPIPTTIERLQAALATGAQGISPRINQLAMSDGNGTVEIAIMSATGGTNTLHADSNAGAPEGGFLSVDKLTLTEFCRVNGIGHIHLAKCDTEGHDLSVVKGAHGMLADGRIGVLQFEYNHRWIYARNYLKDVFDLMAGLPYTMARVMPASIELLPEWHPELERFFEANYAIVHNDALAWFDVYAGSFDVSNTYA